MNDMEVARTAEEAANAAVASLCGLVLRRLQDADEETSEQFPVTKSGVVTYEDLNKIFGEALEQFS